MIAFFIDNYLFYNKALGVYLQILKLNELFAKKTDLIDTERALEETATLPIFGDLKYTLLSTPRLGCLTRYSFSRYSTKSSLICRGYVVLWKF